MVAFILRLKVTYERLFEMGWGCFFLSFFFSFRLKAVSFFKIRMTYQRVFEFSFIYIYVVVFLICFRLKVTYQRLFLHHIEASQFVDATEYDSLTLQLAACDKYQVSTSTASRLYHDRRRQCCYVLFEKGR